MPQRVLIIGASGSGKTTSAARVARLLDLPAYELDALHHGPAWQPMPTFVDAVREFAQRPRWVTEWQYTGKLGDLLPSRADRSKPGLNGRYRPNSRYSPTRPGGDPAPGG